MTLDAAGTAVPDASPPLQPADAADLASIERLRSMPLFDGLRDGQLRELLAVADILAFEPGDVLFREARPADDWWVLLDGTIELVRHVGHEDTVLGAMSSPGQWAGGFQAWDPHGIYLATSRPATACYVLWDAA